MANNVSNKRRYFATALAIALVVFFGFAFLVGTTPVASAENVTYTYDDFKSSYSYGYGTSNLQWLGVPQFYGKVDGFISPFQFPIFDNTDFSSYVTNPYISIIPLAKTSGEPYIDSFTLRSFYGVRLLNSTSSISVDIDLSDSLEHYLILVYCVYNGSSTFTDNALYCYNFTGPINSGFNAVTPVIDIKNLNLGSVAYRSINNSAPIFNYTDDSSFLSRVGVQVNTSYSGSSSVLPFYVSVFIPINVSGTYTIKGSSSFISAVDARIFGVFDFGYVGADDLVDYNNGYNNGYSNGFVAGKNEGYSDGYSSGVTAGKDQANKIVTDTSASYSAGYSKGVEAAGKYTFMSLISSVIDAPIRAFFGYTENGVTHPGLFNLNILGYDMSALVLSLFSACVIIMIIKLCLGGK